MCPAAGQGALGIEIREGDAKTRALLAFLNDPNARAATTCERALLNSLGGGCQVPIGAYAEVRGQTNAYTQSHTGGKHDREGHEFTRADKRWQKDAALAAGGLIHLESIVADPDGSKLLRDSRDGSDPEKLGSEAGAALLARGGDKILEAVYGRGLATPPQP
jgi:hydroxymethylbilane synthase